MQFQQSGDTLNMNVTETNLAGSGVILEGASVFPFALHFPTLPSGFSNASYPQLTYNTTGPSVLAADYGSGMVAAVVPNAQKPLYSGFMPAGQPNAYTPLVSSTTPDGLATFQPHNDRPVVPGTSDRFTVSLRFAASGTSLSTLATDAYKSWAQTWPMLLNWTDRRIIGTAYLASSPTGDPSKPGGYPNNPRRYFNDAQASDLDVATQDGLAKFQKKVLDQATATVGNLQRLNAQGVITWDIEGEQYPQETSYVCSPDQIATVAPEMESKVQDSNSPYAGMKLDDAYFKTIRDAGFRIGVCVRPQQFTIHADGTAEQDYLPDAQIAAQLIRKMKYAHDRWGVTLFYLDSTVEQNGAVLDASLFQKAAAALPDSLLIPEETTPKSYAYTAAFKSFLFHGDTGTDATVYNYYPHAFSVNMVNDVDAGKLAAAVPALTEAVHRGDVLMVHADYWQANNTTVQQIYAAAGVPTSGTTTSSSSGEIPAAPVSPPVATPPSTTVPVTAAPLPAPTTPPNTTSSAIAITSPASDATVSGTVSVVAQMGVTLDAAGSYLMVDGAEIGTHRIVGGPYSYPLDTTTLANGQHTLQIWAHDTGNATVLSGTVRIAVANGSSTGTSTPAGTVASNSGSSGNGAAPTGSAGAASSTAATAEPVSLTYPQSGQAVSGTVSVLATITRTLDAAGSYLMVDGVAADWRRVSAAPYVYELDTSSLSAGVHTLQVWAHDIANETLLSNESSIVVTR